jgi:hypothetical protein
MVTHPIVGPGGDYTAVWLPGLGWVLVPSGTLPGPHPEHPIVNPPEEGEAKA